MLRRVFTLVLVLVAVAAARGTAFAQPGAGSVAGVVRDSSGGTVPGASVQLRRPAGPPVETTTDAQGAYRFETLPPGDYEVVVVLDGFDTVTNRVALADGAMGPA